MRFSIGRRLFLTLTALLVALWFLVIASVSWVVKYETDEVFDSALQETAQRILPLVESQISAGIKDVNNVPSSHDEYLSYQVVNARKEVLAYSHDAPKEPYLIPLSKGIHKQGNQVFYVEPNAHNTLYVVLAESAGHRTSTISDVLLFLGLPLLVIIPLTGLFVLLSVKKAQASIQDLGVQLASRNSFDLHPIETSVLPTELVALGESINSLMNRLRLALEGERNFAANSAHELRTPIAIAMAQMDVLKSELNGKALNRAVDARKMLERLETMTVKLLQLARAEAGVALNLAPLQLSPIVKMIVCEYEFKNSKPIKLSIADGCNPVLGDVDAVGIVVQNLLENACKHGTEDSPVEVCISDDGSVSVLNDCPAVSHELLYTLRQRFVRVDQSKSGSGIGLAIVDAIVRQCRAKLELISPCYPNNRGFMVRVTFALANGQNL